MPNWTLGALIASAVLLTLVDVFSVGLGFRPGSNLTRLFTGLLLGYALGGFSSGLLRDSAKAALTKTQENPWLILGGLGLALTLGSALPAAPGWLYLPATAFLGASVLGIHWFLLGVAGRFLWRAAVPREAPGWLWAPAGLVAAGYLAILVGLRKLAEF